MQVARLCPIKIVMSDEEIARELGSRLREIRKATTETQVAWQHRTGMAQSKLSALESGRIGWNSIVQVIQAIEKAGGDWRDLARNSDVREVDPLIAEIIELLPHAHPVTLGAFREILRREAGIESSSSPHGQEKNSA